MMKRTTESARPGDLRSRAASRLTGQSQGAYQRASEAFGVLHELASSPSTAGGALALLHELQVHQVELDLQAEELRSSREELESALRRHIQLYDRAPVGQFTVDSRGILQELNLTGAALLGTERDALIGLPLAGFLSATSAGELKALLAGASADQPGATHLLQLNAREGDRRVVHARVSTDPTGGAFLVCFMAAGTASSRPAEVD